MQKKFLILTFWIAGFSKKKFRINYFLSSLLVLCWTMYHMHAQHLKSLELGEVDSYRPISLLSIMSGFWKLLLRVRPIFDETNVILSLQFDIRNNDYYAIIGQVFRIKNVIEKSVCSAVFVEVVQASNRLWHEYYTNWDHTSLS